MTDRLRGHAAMLAFSGLIAGSFALGSMAAPHIAPTALNAVRFILASVLHRQWRRMGHRRHPAQRTSQAPWRYLLLGGSMGLYFVLMFEALKTAAPVSAAAVFTLTPIMSGLFGYILLRQVMTPRMGVALAIGAAGALWVIFRRRPAGALHRLRGGPGRGRSIFWGCIAHAFYTPLVRKLNRGERPIVFSFGAMVAAAGLIALAGWSDMRSTDWPGLPAIVWITIIYTAVAATAITFVLLQYASLRLPSAKVMAYTYLTPTWVICWQAALGHGLPPPLILVGVGLTIVALVLLLKDE
jgi:drug/metabolite transporter (DMT)-like permease